MAAECVLLLNPPGPPGVAPNREGAAGMGALAEEGGFVYPPQTLASVAAVLRAAGWPVVAHDAVGAGWGLEEVCRRVAAAGPAVVGLFVSALTLESDLGVLAALRRAHPAGRYLLFGGGLRAVQRALADGLGAVALVGEPEGLMAAACERLARGEAAATGIWTAADLGGSEWVEDLDGLPFPAWDLVGPQRYPFLTVQASRGCPERCLYCPYVVAQGRAWRGRDSEGVLAELRWLRERFRPRRVVFRDPVFARERARVEALCRGLVADPALRPGRGERYWWWEAESRPEHFDRELLQLIRRAGCASLKIGLETVHASLLCALGRTADAAAAARYVAAAARRVEESRRVGIGCRLFVLVGVPGESDQAVAETARFLQEVRPVAVHVKPFVAYPGLAWPEGLCVPSAEETQARCQALRRAAAGPRRGWWRRWWRG